MITINKLKDLFAKLGERSMEQVFSDWETLVGFSAKASKLEVHLANTIDEVAQLIDHPHLVVETRLERIEGSIGKIYFAFPTSLVVEVIADLTMIPEAAKQSKAEGQLDPDDVEAFKEMANLLCGSSNQVFQALRKDLRVSQSVDDLHVWSSEGNHTTLQDCVPDSRLTYLSMQVDAGGNVFPFYQVVPFDVAIELAKQFYPSR